MRGLGAETVDEERRSLPGHVRAHAGLDVVVLHFERLDAEDDVEVGVNFGGALLEIAEDAGDASPRARRSIPADPRAAQEAMAPDEGRWQRDFLATRAETILAGTSEIQRLVIARGLGLPVG